MDTFTTTDPFFGSSYYLWNEAANWTPGIPVNGATALITTSVYGYVAVDNIPDLTLSSLALNYDTDLEIDYNLTVDALLLNQGSATLINPSVITAESGTTFTILGPISSPVPAYLVAQGSGAVLADDASSDAGEIYSAVSGGKVIMAAAPAAASHLNFAPAGSGLGVGTIALENPGSTIATPLNYVDGGDVLELPGTTVESFNVTGSTLQITTDAGSYDFTNVSYNDPIVGYTAALDTTTDPGTKLVAITFIALDTFTDTLVNLTGPYQGDAVWSDASNWTQGIPVNGDSALITSPNGSAIVDDISDLTLKSLSLTYFTDLGVDYNLTVDALLLNQGQFPAGSSPSVVQANSGSTFTILGPISSPVPAYLVAQGSGAVLADDASSDAGEIYSAVSGGKVILAAAPAAASQLNFAPAGSGLGVGTIALENPGSTIATPLNYVDGGDVLELPGSTVLSFNASGSSLQVTTDAGSYDFTNVTYNNPIINYTAATDTTTDPGHDLVAITFGALDTFTTTDINLSGPYQGDAVWSDAANWTPGIPIDGSAALITTMFDDPYVSVDDIPNLTLKSLLLTYDADLEIADNLTVDALSLNQGEATSSPSDVTAESGATLTILGPISSPIPAYFVAQGPDAVLADDASSDPGEIYSAVSGGELILAATQLSTFSKLQFAPAGSGLGVGTIVLENPGSTIAAALNYVDGGDTLELPGSTVLSFDASGSSLQVTTDAGSYDFTNVLYNNPIAGYTQAVDTTTDPGRSLVAITFSALDTFQPADPDPSGSFEYLWGDAANWTLGIPTDGDAVLVDFPNFQNTAIDNIASNLTLSALALTGDAQLEIDDNLTVDALSLGQAVSITVSAGATFTIQGPFSVPLASSIGSSLVAAGPGAVLADNAPSDPGESYSAYFGGELILAATPSTASTLSFASAGSGLGVGTIVLENPGSTIATPLNFVDGGDVLALPGSTVLSFNASGSTLQVTTDAGSYDFTNVTYNDPIVGYTQTTDTTTDPGQNLVAISFIDLGNTVITVGNVILPGAFSGNASFTLGDAGTLQLDQPSLFTGTIFDFIVGDEIDLPSVAYTSSGSALLESGNKLQVSEGGQTYVLQLDPSRTYTSATFLLTPDGSGGTDVSEAVAPTATVAGDWTTPSYWSTGALPGSADDVLINNSTTIVDANPNDQPNKSNGNPQQLENIGTVRSVTVTSELSLDYGALTTIDDFINQHDTAIDIGGSGAEGGSLLTVDATLINDFSLRIGNPNLVRSTTVTANGLVNLANGSSGVGTINLIGSTTSEATLDVNAPAGSGSPGVLSGDFDIEGDALLEFASGQITSLTGSLLINGTHAFVADSSNTTSNSALAGLVTIGPGADLDIENAPSVTVAGNLLNEGFIYLDNAGDGGENGDGGGLVSILGTLTNDGTIDIGNSHITAPDEITANGLDNTSSITLTGASTVDTATLAITGLALNTGTLDINPFGSLTVDGTYEQTGGSLAIAAKGTGSGQYGTLVVNGALDLLGGTSVQVSPTFTPSAGTTLTIITFTPGELSGMFGDISNSNIGTYQNLGNGLTAGLLYNDSLGTVQYEYVATPTTTTDTWTAGATGLWTAAADWSDGTPTFYTDATLGAGANVTLAADATIDSLTLDANAVLTTQSGGSLSIGNYLSLGSGATLTVNGEMTVDDDSAGSVNDGSIVAADPYLDFRFDVSGTGSFTIDAGTTLELDGRDTNTITFAGPGATLIIGARGTTAVDLFPQDFGTLVGFNLGGIVQLDEIVTAVTYSATNHELILSDNGKQVGTFLVSPADNFTNTNFKITVDGNETTIQALVPEVTAVTEAPSAGDLGIGGADTLTLATNEAVTITGTPTLALNDGGTATYDAGKSTSIALAFDYTVGAADMSVPSLAATTIDLPTGASINDAAGNPIASLSLTGLTQAGPQIDTAMPTVTTLTESPATGILGVGASVTFALAISKPVTVLGTPMLVLNDGGMATYEATGSTSTLLLFDYSVAATDVNVSSLAATGLNLSAGLAPARIVDAAGNALNSSSIAGLTQTGPQIDTAATFNFTPPDPSADVEGQTLLSFTSTGSNSFTISFDVDPNSAILENDGIRLVLGPAQYVSGGQSLTFTDAIVTSFSLSSVGETPIDTVAFSYNSALQDVAPAPQAVAESPATGTLGIGALDTLSVTMNEAVVVTGVPTLALNDGGTATYDAAKSTAATLVFDYTVAATDMSVPSLAATAINLPTGATIVDAGGRTITNLSLASLPQAGPEINTAVTMLTESPSTGTLYVGGSDTLTLTMNGAVAVTGTPTLALNDGGTATYDAAESTATSLAFDYRVAATDTSVASLAATTINLPTSASIDDTAGNPIAALSLTGLTQVGPQISIASPTFNFTPTNPSDDVEGQTVLSFSSTGPHSFTIAFDVDANSTIFENDGMKGVLGPAQYVNGSQTQTFTNAIITSVNISSVGEIPFDNVSFSFASESVSCYWRGTLIRADRGEVPVEELAIGDMVLTLGGELRPIKWIGRRVVSRVFADPLHVLPIRIRAEALDKNVPSRDLVLSPDHAILCDDVMIQAGALVNGGSIVRETNVPETFTYYHVELDDHSLILAENTPAETFVDNVDRMGFDNWAEHEALYPDSNMIAEMPYPRAKAYRQVPRSIRKRLTDRAAMLTSDYRDFAA